MRGRDGFTLVEALVALLIVGAALVPLLGSVTAGLRAERRVAEAAALVSLAEARMSALALLPRDSVAGYLSPREGWFPAPFARHRWQAVLRGEPERPGLLRAAVRVEGPDGEFSLETVFPHPGR
jgi:prepilin-type N-terminal cleavage/methylation domain-containing protein